MPVKQNETHYLDVELTCDGPPCQRGTAGPVKVGWQEKPGTAMRPPDEAWRFIVVTLFNNTKFVFCGSECLIAWARRHTPIQSPKEQAEAAGVNMAADELAAVGGPTDPTIIDPSEAKIVEPDKEAILP